MVLWYHTVAIGRSPADQFLGSTWVVVKIMVPFWVPNIVRHLLFRVPKKGALILTTTHMQVGA